PTVIATSPSYALSLHDALPISRLQRLDLFGYHYSQVTHGPKALIGGNARDVSAVFRPNVDPALTSFDLRDVCSGQGPVDLCQVFAGARPRGIHGRPGGSANTGSGEPARCARRDDPSALGRPLRSEATCCALVSRGI